MDQVIGRLLQVGVLIAAAVTLVGGRSSCRAVEQTADYGTFRGVPEALTSLGGIVQRRLAGHSAALVQLGLVLLILTPVARVALTLGAFAIQKDRTYVVLTAIVLVLLLYGLIWGKT